MSTTMAVNTPVLRDLSRLVTLVLDARTHVRHLSAAAVARGDDGRDPIADWLYGAWYLPIPEPVAATSSPRPRADLAAVFRAALPSSSRWSTGWVVLEAGRQGACLAGRRGRARQLKCGEYANVSRPGVPVMPGDAVAIAECIDWVDHESGFWTTQSADAAPSLPYVRLYCSVDVPHMPGVLTQVATTLERLGLRYSLKCPAAAEGFGRVDTLVAYLEGAAWNGVQGDIIALARHLEPVVRSSCPPLTLPLARGVAFAEDPGGNESFGQSRCRILAEAVRVLLELHPLSVEDGVATCLRTLRAARLDSERPWLNGAG